MPSTRLRRTLSAAALAAASSISAIAIAPSAHAAGTWYVATTGSNANACTSAAAPCASIAGVLAKAGFVGNDTINVAPGTYSGTLAFNGKGATIVGTGAGVVFKASPNLYAVATLLAAPQQLSLSNLTLTGGSYSTGGGLFDFAGAVSLSDVTVTGNKAAGAAATAAGDYGGGIYVYNGAKVTMTGGAISDNTATATGGSQGWGGAAYVGAGGALTLDGVTVSGNRADGSTFATAGLGGGVMSMGSTTVKDSTFTDNRALGSGANSGYGGGLYAFSTTALSLSDTVIEGTGAQNAVAGGAIAAASTVTGTNVTIRDNAAQFGGGVYTTGALTLSGSSLSGNKATNAGIGLGGAVYDAGAQPVVLDATTASANSAQVGGGALVGTAGTTVSVRNGSHLDDNTSVSGGAVLNLGTLSVSDSTVNGNTASFEGGGIYNGSKSSADRPSVTVRDSHVDDNTAPAGGGAVVAENASAHFDHTSLSDNTASTYGGGALFNAGASTLTDATLTGNTAAHSSGLTGLGGAIWSGSAVAGATTTLDVSRSYLGGNTGYAGSTILTYGTGTGAVTKASITDSTLDANTATGPFGAIEQAGPMTIARSTITDNAGSVGVYVGQPGALGIADSILAGNTAGACAAGSPVDGGYNLTDVGGCGFTAAAHDVAAKPHLGAVADNGGPTPSRLPAANSPALDAVPASATTSLTDALTADPVTLCAGTDQRGVDRPQGARCDIGAVEAEQVAPTVTGPTSASATFGAAISPLTFTATGSPRPTFSATGLPTGVTLVDNGDGTATLQGTPTAGSSGPNAITVKATNEAGSASTTLTLDIAKGSTALHVDPVILKTSGLLIKITVATVSATLTSASGAPVAGEKVSFTAKSGAALCTGVTGDNGVATCSTGLLGLLSTTLSLGVNGTFAGSSTLQGSSGSAALVG